MDLLAKARDFPRATIAVCSVAVLIGVLAVWLLLPGGRLPDPDAAVTFFDESSSAFVNRPATDVPPLAGNDGQPTVVRAVVTGTPPALDRVKYFFRFNASAQAELQKAAKNKPAGSFDLLLLHEDVGKEVRRPEPGSPWVSAQSREGRRIMAGPQ